MRLIDRFLRGAAVAATVIAVGGFGAAATAADFESVEGASVGDVRGFPAEDFRREGLTKILYGMEYNGAPEVRMKRIRKELEKLGGPDPSVEPLDGPDTPVEWALQADAYQHSCGKGDSQACAALPAARVAEMGFGAS